MTNDIRSTDTFIARWEPFTVAPPEDGRYAVCHRGRMFGSAYYLNGEWSQHPGWEPTHWLNGGYDKLQELPLGADGMSKQLGYTPKTLYR